MHLNELDSLHQYSTEMHLQIHRELFVYIIKSAKLGEVKFMEAKHFEKFKGKQNFFFGFWVCCIFK